jgi:predicted DCC family thiol-disulfide oxidoreductase YuxK
MKAKSSLSRYILAYDTDCGACTRFAHVVDSLDKSEIIDFISIILADQKGLLDRISPPLRYKSFHLIFPNGGVKSGSEALVELIAIIPGGKIVSPIVNYFPGGKPFVSFIYNSFSRRHDMGSCNTNNNAKGH